MVRVNGIALYRGSNKEHHSKPLMWFAVDKAVAKGYAQHRENSFIETLHVAKPLWLVDLGRAEQHSKPLVILSEIIKQSDIKLESVTSKAFEIKEKLQAYSGEPRKDRIIFNMQDLFVDALKLFECDGFVMTEDGYVTYGVLQEKVLCCME